MSRSHLMSRSHRVLSVLGVSPSLINGVRALASTALIAIVASACSEDPTGLTEHPGLASVAIGSMELDKDTVKVAVGGTATVRCFPHGNDGEPVSRNCNWRIRDAAVAEASGNGTRTGTVTGKGRGTTWLVANAEQHRDSALVVVGTDVPTDPPPSDTTFTLVLTPGRATLAIGGTQQFAAFGRTSNGDSVAIQASWTATGGTITANGLYTTGTRAGSYLAIATSGTQADTAEITITTSPVPPSSGWHVTPNGTSGGSGTPTSPWSISHAFAGAGGKIQDGDTVWIHQGTYGNGSTYEVKTAGASGKHVVFSGVPGEARPVIRNYVVVRTGSNYVTLREFKSEGPSGNTLKGMRAEFVHDVTVERCEITGWRSTAGFQTSHTGGNIVIDRCFIHHNGLDSQIDHGIYFQAPDGGTGNRITNSIFWANAARGISLHDNKTTEVKHILVANNTIVGNGSTGLLINDGDFVIAVNNILSGNGAARGQRQLRVLAGNNNQIRTNVTWSSNSSLAGIENQTSSPMSGNIVADPRFVSATNWHLQATSPAIGPALPAWIRGLDYEGKARDAAPDAGAYEY